MQHMNYIIEGIDRLGKNCLIDNLQHRLGFFQVVNFGKPVPLDCYDGSLKIYQERSFFNAMLLLQSRARLLFNRSWLGEAVYADMYRGYSGDYVFDLEKQFHLHTKNSVKLILLTEDFSVSNHFVSDGESFDDLKRQDEQEQFITQFHRSILPNKQIINVTAADGKFRDQQDILAEVLKLA